MSKQVILDGKESTGSSNAYTVWIDGPGYYDGQTIRFVANHANTGAATLSVSGKTAIAIKKRNDVALASGDIEAGQVILVSYNADDNVFEMISNIANDVSIADGSIITAKIADSNVTTAKIADSNVTTAKIADSNVTTAKIADSNVTTAKIADSNVTTAKIADDAVTFAKMNIQVFQIQITSGNTRGSTPMTSGTIIGSYITFNESSVVIKHEIGGGILYVDIASAVGPNGFVIQVVVADPIIP